MDKLYTVKEIAEYLRVHTVSVHRWIAKGKLVATKAGHDLRISQSELNRFVETNKRRVA